MSSRMRQEPSGKKSLERENTPPASNDKKLGFNLNPNPESKATEGEIQSKWPRSAPSLVFWSSSLLTSAELSAATRRGREPQGLRPAPLRLRGVYNPTHYYVRVSRAASFTGTGPSSQEPALLHIAR